jgi:hypothetical protein
MSAADDYDIPVRHGGQFNAATLPSKAVGCARVDRVGWYRLWRSNNRVNLLDLMETEQIHRITRTHEVGSTNPDPLWCFT